MDRLLSEQEIRTARANVPLQPNMEDRRHEAELKAQLAKTDKEWVEWVTTVHAECRCGVCPQYGRDCVLFTPNCIKWQERKKEIGQ